jgi:phenylpropionate dioxygenase-like ring-hydroxylating dioxygenase large terminal subunit
MKLNKYWHIGGFAEEFEKSSFISKKMLSKQIIIAIDSSGAFFAIEDRCCHRNVQLSLGNYNGKHFTCSYHGWQYNSDGKVIHIPSQDEDAAIPKTAKIKTYPVKVKHKLIWVLLSDKPEAAEIAPMPELDSEPYIYTKHNIKADLKFVSESLFDPYHINHVHKNSIKHFMGDLTSQKPKFHLSNDGNSIHGHYFRKNNGTFFDKSYFGFTDQIRVNFEFHFPNISKIQICFEKRTLTIYEHMLKTEDDEIEMIQLTVWNNIFKPIPSFAKWFMKRISNKIVAEDIAFFNSHYALKNDGNADVHVKADELSIAFRRLWEAKLNG